ncbi:MAG: DUF460 domain-containing protein [Candidatus Methanoperedens sp.]|jgi:hypothetical protein|nr:DUF460 domain-containing protein [Candidatus Methanoperedens sp.]PKL54724.1 MAG: DUF460 domain-containing protein [Candidatus Methanoperedenaceae archaeon HGW-Methanoperedenaceae-1]
MAGRTIFGIDIAKGSVKSKEQPMYAVVILEDGRVEHHRMVSQHKFLGMVWKEKPGIVAVDNVFELATDKHGLVSLLRRFPHATKLVQVTGGETLEPLTKLAKQHGFSFDRFDPNEEALACAKLAGLGVGYEVSAFEDKTIIKVSRGRSPGKGGWSQNRYRRKIHGHVRQKAREIEEQLDGQSKILGFTYTQDISERFGGYSKSEFYVDAPRSQVHVSSGKYGDVQVRVSGIERDALVYKPLKIRKRDYIIVGIDPGTTTAVAVLTLSGEMRFVSSSRTASISDVIEMISEQGRPLIIASDVFPTPNTVEKIRRAFNAVPGSPDDVLTLEDKIELARPFEYSNAHERDAIAAAASVYRKNRNKFEQIRKKIPQGVDADEALAMVVRGKAVDAVLSELTRKEEKQPETGKTPEKAGEGSLQLRELVRKYEEEIAEMKAYQHELESKLRKKDSRIRELEKLSDKMRTDVYKQLKKEKGIKVRDKDIARLKHQVSENSTHISRLMKRIDKLKTVRRLEISGRVLPVKIISAFTKDSIMKTQEEAGIKKDDIIILKDASGGGTITAKMLSDMGVRAVIICNDMSHAAEEELFNMDVPVVDVKDVKLQFDRTEEFAVVKPEDIERAIEEWKKMAETRKKADKEKWLESLVDEYRSERRRAIK